MTDRTDNEHDVEIITTDNIRERHFAVDNNFEGWRLDSFLANRLGRLSRTKAAKIAKHGDVSIVPHRPVKPSVKLLLGDVVILKEHLPPEAVQDDQVRVLYEDDALILLDKPAGMLVHESARVRMNTIQGYLSRHGHEEAEAVHRLDKDTSGVLVCARRKQWVAPMRQLFATSHPEKIYRAIVLDPHHRWTPGQKETFDWPLGLVKGEVLDLRMGAGTLACRTHVEALKQGNIRDFGRVVDVRVRIETGRQHQIRAHLDMAGTPIAGDKLYGQTDDFFMAICDRPDDLTLQSQLAFDRQALHAWQMIMPHPASPQTLIEVQAPLPNIWHDDSKLQWDKKSR